MKRKDIEAVGLPGAFVIEGPSNGPYVKGTVLETGITPRYSTTANSVRVRLEEGYLAAGRLFEPGGVYVILALHVQRPWSEAEEADFARRAEGFRVAKTLDALMPTLGMSTRYAALRSTDGGQAIKATCDGAALLRLIDVFGMTKQSEHFTLALRLAAGDENAADVVAAMDPGELMRYTEVADRVFPGSVLA